MAPCEEPHGNGRFTAVTRVRDLNDVRRRSGDDALAVQWFALTGVKAKTGEQLSPKSGILKHRLPADNVVDMARSGRARGKIENPNVLKT